MNERVLSRLRATLQNLNSAYDGTSENPSAVKGAGRSEFIHKYLEQVMPQGLRIKTNGHVIDSFGSESGEVDIVIENGMFPNMPLGQADSARLYFAEGVAAVIEVKSNLSAQWEEVISTGEKLNAVRRKFAGGHFSTPGGPSIVQLPVTFSDSSLPKYENPKQRLIDRVPYFVVGYTGWVQQATIEGKLKESPNIAGILQLDKGIFVGNSLLKGVKIEGPLSLLCFIDAIHQAFSYIKMADFDLLDYGR